MTGEFNIRALEPDDWLAFRVIRLLALSTHQNFFGAKHEEELQLGEGVWRERLSNTLNHVSGLFDSDQLIGISAALTDYNEPHTAWLAMWFLREEYQGRGLFHALAKASLDWAMAQQKFHRALISHREGNDSSRRANQKLGFVHIETRMEEWPDGEIAPKYIYERKFDR